MKKQNETELKMEYLMQECVRARARDSSKYNKLIKCIAMPTVLDLDGIYWIVIVYAAGWLEWVGAECIDSGLFASDLSVCFHWLNRKSPDTHRIPMGTHIPHIFP